MGTEPVGGRDTPPVARHQSREPVVRNRRGQVVADGPLVLKKLGGDDSADRVAPMVLRSCRATPVTEEAGDGVGAARLQFPPDDVSLDHGPLSLMDRARPAPSIA